MVDTDAIAPALIDAKLTPDMLRAEIATLRADLTWRMVAVGGLVVAAPRLLG